MKLSSNAIAGIGLAVVALAGPAGFMIYRVVLGNYHPTHGVPPGQIRAAPASSAPRSPTPSSAPASSAPPAAALPSRLPDVALVDATGKPHRLSDYRGKPLLLNFWASWCEPCRREIPLLSSLRRQHDTLQVVGVALDFRADAIKFAASQGIDYPLLLGETGGLAAAEAVGIRQLALPFTVIADDRGDIVTVKLGELHQDEATLILGRLDALSAGRESLESARRDISDGLRDLAVARARQAQARTPVASTAAGSAAPWVAPAI